VGLLAAGSLVFGLGFWSNAWGAAQDETPALTSAPDEASPAKRLIDLLISQQADGTRVVLVGDGRISNYNAFTLLDPPRIVVDVWSATHGFGSKKIPVLSQELERVRIGSYPDKVRLVFDLDQEGAGFPPYGLSKDGHKLLVCLGDLAKNGDMEATALPMGPPDDRVAATSSQESVPAPASDGQVQEASLAGEETEGEQTTLDQLALKSDSTDWALPSASKRESSEETPQLAEIEAIDSPKAQETKTPPAGSKEDAPVSEEVLIETIAAELTPERGSFAKEESGAAKVARKETSQDMMAKKEPAQQSAFSLAQVSGSSDTQEAEEPFDISTGMEPGKVYVGERLNLDFQDIDIDNVFRLLAEVSNLNIIVSDKVKGKITMRVKDVPWDQALDLLIATNRLGMLRQGNVIRIAPLKDLMAEERERKKLRDEKLKAKIEEQQRAEQAEIERQEREQKLRELARPFETKNFQCNYTKAKDVNTQIKGLLTALAEKKGTAIIDDRTNMITVTDWPEVLAEIERYLALVDIPTPQVLIEARVVKASKTFAREIGVQWGTQYAEYRGWSGDPEYAFGISSGQLTATPVPSPSTWTSSSFSGGTGADFNPLSSWMVNLPAALLAPSPGVGFQIGRLIGDLFGLDLRLSAAETDGLTKIISRPKIMTLDNVEATIKQGFEIPYTQVNPEGNVSVVWKQAELRTTVTPLISPDGRVHLKMEITDDFPDPAITSAEGEPSIRTRQAYTEVLVRDGETVVIGGILEETDVSGSEGVPWLKDIPLLEWLFERKRKSNEQNELLIFVTPFIVRET
jgi:type IV pilus assembly protein PilQ